MRPRDVIGHQPGEPLDLPSQVHAAGAGGVGDNAAGAVTTPPTTPVQRTPREPANITVTPPVRNVDRTEK